jgi:hypothetical protein
VKRIHEGPLARVALKDRVAGNRQQAKSLDVLVVPLFAFFIMKIRSDPGEPQWAGVQKHVDIVRALREGRMLFGAGASDGKQ